MLEKAMRARMSVGRETPDCAEAQPGAERVFFIGTRFQNY
jgi:hypothetical protein